MAGVRGAMPVARMISSKPPRPAPPHRRGYQAQVDAGALHLVAEVAQGFEELFLPGTRLATLNWPPISLAASNRVT
jgi:hypothetical protein